MSELKFYIKCDKVPHLMMYYRFEFGNVKMYFPARKGGVSEGPFSGLNLSFRVGDEDEKVKTNRRIFFEKIGLEESKLVTLNQIHSNIVRIVDKPQRLEGDGLITFTKHLALGVYVADCVALYLVGKDYIGILHVGRRGLENGIIEEAFKLIEPPECAVMSPSICPTCYEVDLWEGIEERLKKHGVERIFNPKICTYENPEQFFSYRRDKGKTGRHLAIITQI